MKKGKYVGGNRENGRGSREGGKQLYLNARALPRQAATAQCRNQTNKANNQWHLL